jgi:lysyl endopeptidase
VDRIRPCRLLLAALLCLGAATAAPAADDPTAVPTAWLFDARPLDRIETIVLAPLDPATLALQDLERELEDLPPRFAVPWKVTVSPATHGEWEKADDETLVWRYRVRAPGSLSLNLGFTRYRMPASGRLLLYTPDGGEVRGPFTADDNDAHGQLWTPVLLADDVVVEVTIAAADASRLELELGQIGQGYRGFDAPGEKSGACNMDIECLDPADPWRQTAKAVAVISTGGSTFCSGSMVNNTAEDKTPLFVTAHHCGINSGNAASLVAYWNYQNSTCRTPGSGQSGGPGDGSLAQYNTGSILRADYSTSDVTLVELDDPIDPAFDLYWAGWDRTPYTPPGGVGNGDFACAPTPDPNDLPDAGQCATIHHPNTDEKRITFVEMDTATTSYGGTTPPGDGTHVWAHWDADPPYFPSPPGVTEPGSSGSPLYTADHRFIGQLHGGPSACGATGDNLSDYYGRFSVSWTGGGTSSTRLSDWLDPLGLGVLTLDGRGECTPPATPADLVATPNGDNRIDLAWSPVAGAETYRVFRADGACPGSGTVLLAEGLTAPAYSDFSVSGGSTYSYTVTAVDADQPCESPRSACADATATGACTRDPVFAGLAGAASRGEATCGVDLIWEAATPSCGGALVYNVYRSTTAGFTPDLSTLLARCLAGSSWTDTSAASGAELHYVVRAEESGVGAGPCAGGIEDGNLVERTGVASGPDAVLLEDDVESGAAGWTANGSGGGSDFAIVTTDHRSGTHAWFVSDPNVISDRRLERSAAIVLPPYPARLEFWQRMVSEPTYDGGVLELSTDGGTTWIDALDGNPGRFVAGGYTNVISSNFQNPLAGRAAWEGNVGNVGNFERSELDLGDFRNQSLSFRFRFGSDTSVSATGWWLDDVRLSAGTACDDSSLFADGFESGDTSRWSYGMASPSP